MNRWMIGCDGVGDEEEDVGSGVGRRIRVSWVVIRCDGLVVKVLNGCGRVS